MPKATKLKLKATGRSDRLVKEVDRELLCRVVLGFLPEAEDPVQAGETCPRQSAEITRLTGRGHEVPINKNLRDHYVWVAKANPKTGQEDVEM